MRYFKDLLSVSWMGRVAVALAVLHSVATSANATVISQPLNGLQSLNFNPSGSMSVQAYLDSVLGPGVATISGQYAWGNGYDGEGYVVGPTLGSGGGNFLRTSQTGGKDKIIITLNQPIYGISFAFEIFPDGNVPDGRTTSPSNANWPDFTFDAYLDSALVEHFYAQGVIPSGSSANNSPEYAPQLLSSASFTFPNGVNKLEFIDWPPTIGVDDLNLNFGPVPQDAPVPEPGTLLLILGCLGGVGVRLYLLRKERLPVIPGASTT